VKFGEELGELNKGSVLFFPFLAAVDNVSQLAASATAPPFWATVTCAGPSRSLGPGIHFLISYFISFRVIFVVRHSGALGAVTFLSVV
jgi:hypothetical protein